MARRSMCVAPMGVASPAAGGARRVAPRPRRRAMAAAANATPTSRSCARLSAAGEGSPDGGGQSGMAEAAATPDASRTDGHGLRRGGAAPPPSAASGGVAGGAASVPAAADGRDHIPLGGAQRVAGGPAPPSVSTASDLPRCGRGVMEPSSPRPTCGAREGAGRQGAHAAGGVANATPTSRSCARLSAAGGGSPDGGGQSGMAEAAATPDASWTDGHGLRRGGAAPPPSAASGGVAGGAASAPAAADGRGHISLGGAQGVAGGPAPPSVSTASDLPRCGRGVVDPSSPPPTCGAREGAGRQGARAAGGVPRVSSVAAAGVAAGLAGGVDSWAFMGRCSPSKASSSPSLGPCRRRLLRWRPPPLPPAAPVASMWATAKRSPVYQRLPRSAGQPACGSTKGGGRHAGVLETRGGVSGRARVVVERAGSHRHVRRSGGAYRASPTPWVRRRRRGSVAASSSAYHQGQKLARECGRDHSARTSPAAFSGPPPCDASTRQHPLFSKCVCPIAGGGGKRKRQAPMTEKQCFSADAGDENGQCRDFASAVVSTRGRQQIRCEWGQRVPSGKRTRTSRRGGGKSPSPGACAPTVWHTPLNGRVAAPRAIPELGARRGGGRQPTGGGGRCPPDRRDAGFFLQPRRGTRSLGLPAPSFRGWHPAARVSATASTAPAHPASARGAGRLPPKAGQGQKTVETARAAGGLESPRLGEP